MLLTSMARPVFVPKGQWTSAAYENYLIWCEERDLQPAPFDEYSRICNGISEIYGLKA